MNRMIAIGFVLACTLLAGCPQKPAELGMNGANGEKSPPSPWGIISEDVSPKNGHNVTRRIPVPGGWIYQTIAHCDHGLSVEQTFVPDANQQSAERTPCGDDVR